MEIDQTGGDDAPAAVHDDGPRRAAAHLGADGHDDAVANEHVSWPAPMLVDDRAAANHEDLR
jgi:hypothetical protein